ncbi:hypothetical protein [Alkalihalobacillus hemicellulosilyticus]|nr:hypothetical protein [Halalkalibacter hemicellulosilyticus]
MNKVEVAFEERSDDEGIAQSMDLPIVESIPSLLKLQQITAFKT